MNKRHIRFKDRRMHVRTAVETLSKSTADALEFLKVNGVKNVADADATIKFTRKFDRIWDVCNTQRIRSNQVNVFKSAINPDNAAAVFEFLLEAKEYIRGLSLKSKRTGLIVPILNSDNNTGFRGFIMDIDSITAMYTHYVEDKHLMPFIATYRLPQDHLEMFFGKFQTEFRSQISVFPLFSFVIYVSRKNSHHEWEQ